MTHAHRVLAAVLVAVLGLGVAGCATATDPRAGGERERDRPAATTPTGVPGGRNEVDVDFAQMMLVHHRQAVSIAALAADHTDSAAVIAVADAVAATQGPEVTELTDLLVSWGEEVPDDIDMSTMDHSQMDHSNLTDGGLGMGFMAGMASDEKIALLEASTGAVFDKAFLRLVRMHLGGGVAMAQSEQWAGGDAELIDVARRMETDQAEIMDSIEQALKAR